METRREQWWWAQYCRISIDSLECCPFRVICVHCSVAHLRQPNQARGRTDRRKQQYRSSILSLQSLKNCVSSAWLSSALCSFFASFFSCHSDRSTRSNLMGGISSTHVSKGDWEIGIFLLSLVAVTIQLIFCQRSSDFLRWDTSHESGHNFAILPEIQKSINSKSRTPWVRALATTKFISRSTRGRQQTKKYTN